MPLPAYGQVNDWYNKYLGRPTSPDEFTGWANSPNDIEGQISGSPEAAAYRLRTPAPTPPTSGVNLPAPPQAGPGAPPPPPTNTAPPGGGTRQKVEDYYKSRNTSPFPTSVDYWTNKLDQGGDYNYYWGRLGNADEFRGQPGYVSHDESGGSGTPTLRSPQPSTPPPNPATWAPPSGPPAPPPNWSPGWAAPPPQQRMDPAALSKTIMDLMQNGGGFNQGIVDRRTNAAADTLNRTMKSRNASNRAQLAERGLLGSGPEATAQNRAESDLADQYKGAVSGIYANESQNADARMTHALSLAANMSNEDASNAIQDFRARTEQGLGLGNLALGNRAEDTSRFVGAGQLGLGGGRLGLDTELGRGNLAQGQQRLNLDQMLGMSGLDLQRLGLNNAFTLGQGNLALGNTTAANAHNLDLARFGFDREKWQQATSDERLKMLMALLPGLNQGANTAAEGYM